MQSSSEQPLVGDARYVTTLITAARETRYRTTERFLFFFFFFFFFYEK